MLVPQLLRELRLAPGMHPQQRQWLSAASGLVFAGHYLHVVADDELHLGSFEFDPLAPASDISPVHLLPLLTGELPIAPKLRKDAKPDLETLLWLPMGTHGEGGSLLALGSGRKLPRRHAISISLTASGKPMARAVELHDFAALFKPLEQQFPDLNIEGALIQDSTLTLLQRGNKGEHGRSACLQFALDHFVDWIRRRTSVVPSLLSVLPLDFGEIKGVPLCPTDAATLPDGNWVVTLVAEDTNNSIADGVCVGSAIALMSNDNQLLALHRLANNPKVEGVSVIPATSTNNSPSLLLVTDADDPAQCSQLLRLDLP